MVDSPTTNLLLLEDGGAKPGSLLDYRGHLCNLRDNNVGKLRGARAAKWNCPTERNGPRWLLNPEFKTRPRALTGKSAPSGRVIWGPSLPGASKEIRLDWYACIRAAGGTHVALGAFTPGYAYPGVEWANPDWTNDPKSIRALIEEIIDNGLFPHVFLDGGGPNPKPRMNQFFPVAKQAMDGLWKYVLTTPTGWEPVEGDYISAEVSYGFIEWHELAPEAEITYHGSPRRLVGSTNWYDKTPDPKIDPWLGGEQEFYKTHGGEHVQRGHYQTEHGSAIYTPCTCPNKAEKFGHRDECWRNRMEDYLGRMVGGHNNWRRMGMDLWETIAYEFMRGLATSDDARNVASAAKEDADKWGVQIGYGNGLPWEMA